MEALNPLQAAVGDRVVLRMEASALIRNLGSLVGLPVLFLVLGWFISLFLGDTVLVGLPITFLSMFCSLPLGVAAGVLLYRHRSRGNLPTITRITQTRLGMASSFVKAQESNA